MKTQLAVSLTALFLASMHLFWGGLTLDAPAIALLVLAALPWLAPFLKALELPGGWKFSFRDDIVSLPRVSSASKPEIKQVMVAEAAVDSGSGSDLSTQLGRGKHRNAIYDENRKLFIVHAISPLLASVE